MKFAMMILALLVISCSKDGGSSNSGSATNCSANMADLSLDRADINATVQKLVDSGIFNSGCDPEATINQIDERYEVECMYECTIQEKAK